MESARIKPVSARELAAVLNHLGKLIGSRPTANQRIGNALLEAGKMLDEFGPTPFGNAFRERGPPSRANQPEDGGALSDLPLDRVREIVRDPDAPRRLLID